MPIFPTQNTLPQTRIIAGLPMVDLPGGIFAMGSQISHEAFGNCQPRMVRVQPFAAGVTHVTEDQYRETIGRPGRDGAPGNHPVTCVSVADCKVFLNGRNRGKAPAEELGFLTEAELEFMARGPVVNVRQLMAKEGLPGSAGLQEYLSRQGDFLENFVPALELGAAIVATPKSDGFARLIDSASPVFAWRAFATCSGRLNAAEAWIDKKGTAPVSLTDRVNGYGVSDAVGNVWSWGSDRYQKNAYEILPQENPYNEPLNGTETIVMRGASWGNDVQVPQRLRVAYRFYYTPIYRGDVVGVRVGGRAAMKR